MITDEKFLSTIDPYQLSYYFGPKKELPEKNVIQEVDEEQEEVDLNRKASEYNPSSI